MCSFDCCVVFSMQSWGRVNSQMTLLVRRQCIFLCRGGGMGSQPMVSYRFPLRGQSAGCFSWTGHSHLCSKINKQDLLINSSLSTRYSESSHAAWNGNPSWAGCFWQIRCSLVTRSDWFLPFIPPHPLEHNTRYFPPSIEGKAKKPKGLGTLSSSSPAGV